MNILETYITNDKITKIKYFIESNGVQTEGYLTLKIPMNVVENLQEDDVVKYVEKDSQEFLNLIESRLQEQAQMLEKPATPPWLVEQTFTPGS
jgi:hypothetical protein